MASERMTDISMEESCTGWRSNAGFLETDCDDEGIGFTIGRYDNLLMVEVELCPGGYNDNLEVIHVDTVDGAESEKLPSD
ncbi:hypothetical protein AVEN_150232-1 [Araneus ventricosus]|uniref:Uncharacterized protein n=1 Tax=Araneus ventricosus TaxID=182803 RepID=A0A4Y2G5K9_ARAVE|nr:hypothetical protein AVEN_150232-1 [Araneus ventricosus]